VSLATALRELPNDRATRLAVVEVLTYLERHQATGVEASHIAAVAGLSVADVERVLAALSRGFVVDCGADEQGCAYAPAASVRTEVERFLYSSGREHERHRGSVERYRGRFTRGR